LDLFDQKRASLFCLGAHSVMGDGNRLRLDFFGSFLGDAKKNKAELSL
jgi:hypothetical protein